MSLKKKTLLKPNTLSCSVALSGLDNDIFLDKTDKVAEMELYFIILCLLIIDTIRPKKKFFMLPSPDQNLKIGSVGRFFFFFFFFTYRERVEFSNIFLKVSNWGKLGRNAVKTHIQVLF